MTATPSTCAHTDHLVEQAALRLLSPADQQRLDQRLAECPTCRARLTEYQVLAAAMARLDLPTGGMSGAVPFAQPPVVAHPHEDFISAPQRVSQRSHALAGRRHREGWYVAAALLLLVGMTALIFNTFVVRTPVATGPLATRTPAPKPTPRPLALPPGTMLADLSLLSPDEGWAVGDIIDGSPSASGSTAVFLHLTDGSWILTDQRFPGVHVETISMASAGDGWAGGNKWNADHTALVGTMLHYANGRWSQVAVPGVGNVYKVQMLSADDGWALASEPAASGVQASRYSGILHYQHGVWSPVTFPASFPSSFWLYWHAGVADLSMATADEGWAVCQGLVVHYSHGEWQYRGMLDGLGETSRIAMVSPTDGWIGSPPPNVASPKEPATSPTARTPTAYHYDGAAWRLAELPAALGAAGGNTLLRFVPGPASTVYLLAGVFLVGKSSPTSVLHYVGGVWQPVAFPHNLFITAIEDGWALGWVQAQRSWVSVILFEQSSGEWAAYPVSH